MRVSIVCSLLAALHALPSLSLPYPQGVKQQQRHHGSEKRAGASGLISALVQAGALVAVGGVASLGTLFMVRGKFAALANLQTKVGGLEAKQEGVDGLQTRVARLESRLEEMRELETKAASLEARLEEARSSLDSLAEAQLKDRAANRIALQNIYEELHTTRIKLLRLQHGTFAVGDEIEDEGSIESRLQGVLEDEDLARCIWGKFLDPETESYAFVNGEQWTEALETCALDLGRVMSEEWRVGRNKKFFLSTAQSPPGRQRRNNDAGSQGGASRPQQFSLEDLFRRTQEALKGARFQRFAPVVPWSPVGRFAPILH